MVHIISTSVPWMPQRFRRAWIAGLWSLGSVVCWALSLCLWVSLFSYDPGDPSWNTLVQGPIHNQCGVVGSYVADILRQMWGVSAYIWVFIFGMWGWLCLRHRLTLHSLLWGVTYTPFASWWWASVVSACGGDVLSLMPWTGLWGLNPPTAWSPVFTDARLTEAMHWGLCLLISMVVCLGSFRVCGVQTSLFSKETWRPVGRVLKFLGCRVVKGAQKLMRLVRRDKPAEIQTLVDERASERAFEHELVLPLESLKPSSRKRHTPSQMSVHVLPSLDLLSPSVPSKEKRKISPQDLQNKSQELKAILNEFGVQGEVVQAHPGPVVTLFEFRPAPGVKSSRVVSLADDVARSMSALSTRIATVPGRDVMGIEIPQDHRETVFIRDILSSKVYEKTNATLPLILGKDIGGEVVIADLTRMPHLLVAGTTGSGKSVAVNSMILSLLYRLSPEQCRLIMIDPKMLELSIYEGIPHLLAPVVTDPKQAVTAVRWVVKEMERRYQRMSQLGVRNIDGYNQRLAQDPEAATMTEKVQTGFCPETKQPLWDERVTQHKALPYIVVVVDEMADLMLVAGKDIEASIQRLAQMARAAGIHIIMATQRPSVDVITGTIKANFPTRISFQVTSKIDSRTILGEQGAEQLLGQGDMLYMAAGGRIVRLHGPFVQDRDVEKVVEFLKSQGEPDYVKNLTVDEDEEGGEVTSAGDEGDDMYQQAIELVRRTDKASTSFIQRHFQIGYNRAARLMERLEQEGIVSEPSHAGKRQVIR